MESGVYSEVLEIHIVNVGMIEVQSEASKLPRLHLSCLSCHVRLVCVLAYAYSYPHAALDAPPI